MPKHSFRFDAIGTRWSIETDQPLTEHETNSLHEEIEHFDHAYSRFRPDSLVSRARDEAPGTFLFPESIKDMYRIYELLHALSDGAITPLIGESLERLGYDAAYSFRVDTPYPAASLGKTVSLAGSAMTFHRAALLDVGAIGKGLLVDTLAKKLASHMEYVVDGSGDIVVNTVAPEVVGLEDPRDPDRVIGHVSLNTGSLCASSINRRTWADGVHHIIDGRTGQPIESDIIATWAVANDALTADALTTGLFFVKPAELQHVFGSFTYVIMSRNGSVSHNIRSQEGELYI